MIEPRNREVIEKVDGVGCLEDNILCGVTVSQTGLLRGQRARHAIQ